MWLGRVAEVNAAIAQRLNKRIVSSPRAGCHDHIDFLLTDLAFHPHQIGEFHTQRRCESFLALKGQQKINVATPQVIVDPAAKQFQAPRGRLSYACPSSPLLYFFSTESREVPRQTASDGWRVTPSSFGGSIQ
jgi:hypothetical protein